MDTKNFPYDEFQSLFYRSKEAVDLIHSYILLAGKYIPVGYDTIIPSNEIRNKCEQDLFLICVSNLYSLFDSQGTNFLKTFKNTSNETIAELIREFIQPTWFKLRLNVIKVRANLGHHAPYHLSGKQLAENLLEDFSPGEIISFTLACRKAILLASALRGEIVKEDIVFKKLPIKNIDFSLVKECRLAELEINKWLYKINTELIGRWRLPNIYRYVKDNTWNTPLKFFSNRIKSMGSKTLQLHIKETEVRALSSECDIVRDHFLVTNSLFLVYYSHLRWHLPIIGFAWLDNTHTMLITWYSHLYTLFEEGRVTMTTVFYPIIDDLPPYSKWLYTELIIPEWEKNKHHFQRLRNKVGFHRERSHKDAERIHEEFIELVPPESTTYLMRILYLFFWSIETWQLRELSTVSIPHWKSVDALDPRHKLSTDHQYYLNKKINNFSLFPPS